MKRLSTFYEILIFSLIFLFCIVPPFFTKQINQDDILFIWNFPFQQLSLCIFAVILYFFSKQLNINKKIFFPSILTLGILFTFELFFKFLFKLPESVVIKPQSFIQWIYCILTFLFSAAYEEIIYRFYFPDALLNILKNFSFDKKKSTKILIEIVGTLVFAFAHLYLGIISVINAALAHIVLRILYKKTNLIWNGVIIHFIYNVISLILL